MKGKKSHSRWNKYESPQNKHEKGESPILTRQEDESEESGPERAGAKHGKRAPEEARLQVTRDQPFMRERETLNRGGKG